MQWKSKLLLGQIDLLLRQCYTLNMVVTVSITKSIVEIIAAICYVRILFFNSNLQIVNSDVKRYASLFQSHSQLGLKIWWHH